MNSNETIIAIILMIVLGYICRRTGFLKPDDTQTLNKIALYIAIPSLIFLAMYQADLSEINTLGTISLVCITVAFICGLIAYLFTLSQGYSSKTRWSIVTTSAMCNAGFLGYPVVLGVYGGAGLIRAVFYDIGNTIIFVVFGLLFVFMYGGNFQSIIQRSILFPPMLAVILGILVNLSGLSLGFVVSNVLEYLSGAAIPLIMLSLGLSLEFSKVKEYWGAASFVSAIRLLVAPLIALFIIFILGWGGLDRAVTVVEAGMPSAMLSLVLAITYDLDVNLSAACIFLSTTLSMISIPVIILIL